MNLPTLEQFLAATNGKARVRVFDADDYECFVEKAKYAQWMASTGSDYYWECNMGGVGKSYKYSATTARMGVYVMPPCGHVDTEYRVALTFDRVKAYGSSVKCVFPNGERSYRKWFRERTGGGVKA